ncbi:TIGR00297 family protein [soil metagenome]
MAAQLLIAFLVTAAFAVLAYALGMISRSGALSGLLIGTAIYASLGPQGFALLALFVVGGSLLTRLGYRRKQSMGTAQDQGGRRGARNAIANCAVAVSCALLAAATTWDFFTVAFVASLGAAFADTSESEIGQLFSRTPRMITTLRKVQPGTDGAISLPGTLAGVAAACLTAALALALGLLESPQTALLVALAAFLGTVADSLIGAHYPRIGNEATNVICTLVAAVLAPILT